MIVRHLRLVEDAGGAVNWGNGSSVRLLTQKDAVPFTVAVTTVNAGSSSYLEYNRHIEACYCVRGSGRIRTMKRTWNLEPGVLYCLDQNEAHYLDATTDLELISVFSPALHGDEQHVLDCDTPSTY